MSPVSRLRHLQAVLKEHLHLHPPGSRPPLPLLQQLSNLKEGRVCAVGAEVAACHGMAVWWAALRVVGATAEAAAR